MRCTARLAFPALFALPVPWIGVVLRAIEPSTRFSTAL